MKRFTCFLMLLLCTSLAYAESIPIKVMDPDFDVIVPIPTEEEQLPPPLISQVSYLGGWSFNWGTAPDYTSSSNIVMLQFDNFVAGYYKNSFSNDTYVLGWAFDEWTIAQDLNVGLMVGMSHGFPNDETEVTLGDSEFAPIAVPYITFTRYAVQPMFGLMGTDAAFIAFRLPIMYLE